MRLTRSLSAVFLGLLLTLASAHAGLITQSGARLFVSESGSGDWQLEAGHFIAQKMAMVRVHPRPDSEMAAWARAARAPAGIAWSIPIVVQGGAWPLHYECTDCNGATIGEDLPANWTQDGLGSYGILTWSNPTVGSHTFTVTVSDQDGGLTLTVDWTLEVIASDNTTYFIFLDDDGASDNSGTGTPASPEHDIRAWWGANEDDTVAQGKQIFYRAGTYNIGGLGLAYESGCGCRLPMNNTKPLVHIGYPGETATITTNEGYFLSEATNGDFAIQHLRLTDPTTTDGGNVKRWFMWTSTDRLLFHDNTFVGDTASPAGSSNPGAVFLTGGIGSLLAEYVAFTRNTFDDLDNMPAALIYNAINLVYEGNVVQGSAGGHLYLKGENISFVSIRANRGHTGNSSYLAQIDSVADPTEPRDNIEVAWNSWISTGEGLFVGPSDVSFGDNLWSYRNSYQISHNQISNPNEGAIEFENDVIQHDGTCTSNEGICESASAMTLTRTSVEGGTSNYLNGTTNLLIGSGSAFLGTHGAEVQ
jgi:hypothetical protein